jgi:hypothetical protein
MNRYTYGYYNQVYPAPIFYQQQHLPPYGYPLHPQYQPQIQHQLQTQQRPVQYTGSVENKVTETIQLQVEKEIKQGFATVVQEVLKSIHQGNETNNNNDKEINLQEAFKQRRFSALSSTASLPSSPKEIVEVKVTEAFVKECNENFGSEETSTKVQDAIKKMRILGGLQDPENGVRKVNIPEARMGLAILSGIRDKDAKMSALDSLLTLLKNDSLSSESSHELWKLTEKLTDLLYVKESQFYTTVDQIKYTEVYSLALELIQRHYGKKHIGAVTKDFKTKLTNTAQSLHGLNRRDEIKLAYYVGLSREAIRRIVDDQEELVEAGKRCFNVVAAISTLFHPLSWNPSNFSGYAGLAVDGINLQGPESWYNDILVINELSKKTISKDEKDPLFRLQGFVQRKSVGDNWKTAYASVEALYRISLEAKTESTALQALLGYLEPRLVRGSQEVGGLKGFVTYNVLHRYRNFKKDFKHIQVPRLHNPNIHIRANCVEKLIKLSDTSQYDKVRNTAIRILLNRIGKETERDILVDLTNFLNNQLENQQDPKILQEVIVVINTHHRIGKDKRVFDKFHNTAQARYAMTDNPAIIDELDKLPGMPKYVKSNNSRFRKISINSPVSIFRNKHEPSSHPSNSTVQTSNSPSNSFSQLPGTITTNPWQSGFFAVNSSSSQ